MFLFDQYIIFSFYSDRVLVTFDRVDIFSISVLSIDTSHFVDQCVFGWEIHQLETIFLRALLSSRNLRLCQYILSFELVHLIVRLRPFAFALQYFIHIVICFRLKPLLLAVQDRVLHEIIDFLVLFSRIFLSRELSDIKFMHSLYYFYHIVFEIVC